VGAGVAGAERPAETLAAETLAAETLAAETLAAETLAAAIDAARRTREFGAVPVGGVAATAS
jgi:hypothetical protein